MMTGSGPIKEPPPRHAGRDLHHGDCVGLYYRQAKLFWREGVLTRRDRALLDQLRVGLGLSLSEAARLEVTAARAVATPEEKEIEPFGELRLAGADFLSSLGGRSRRRSYRSGNAV